MIDISLRGFHVKHSALAGIPVLQYSPGRGKENLMARPPDGPTSRESTISVRVTDADRKEIQANRFATGDRSNSNYIRRLVREDTKRRLGEQKSA